MPTKNESASIVENSSRVIVGKKRVLELMTVALLAEGHVLLEDVPGLGKTVMAKALARSIGGSFSASSSRPIFLPSDVTGFSIYNQKSANSFSIRPRDVQRPLGRRDQPDNSAHPGQPS